MKKTRTQRGLGRYRGPHKRTRKQRGGIPIKLLVKKARNNGSEYTEELSLNIDRKTITPRNIFNIYQRENITAQRGNRPLFRLNGRSPRFILKTNGVQPYYWPAVAAENWNARGKEFLANKTYYFQYKENFPENIAEDYRTFLPIIIPVLIYYLRRYGGAKVILGSSAATEVIHKNVQQQMKFEKNPKNPIILVDASFFDPNRYEFYKYLRFEEDVELSEHLDPTRMHVKVFRKPEGRPFEILEDAANVRSGRGGTSGSNLSLRNTIKITENDKKEYLAEVKKQMIDEDGKPLFNEMSELEICCVKMPFEGLESSELGGSLVDLLRSFGERSDGIPIFPAYTYQQ